MQFQTFQKFYDYNGDKRLRVSAVQATEVILPQHGTPRDDNAQPLALYSSKGTIDPRPIHTDRGHLIGLQFGGPESSGNLVPMYGGFNSPAGGWGKFEASLKKHLNSFGTAVDLKINIYYENNQTPVPNGFVINVAYNRGNALSTELASEIRLQHPQPISFYMEPDTFILEASKLLQDHQNVMEEACWYIELQESSSGVRKNELMVGGLDPKSIDFTNLKQKQAFYISRPYSVLDFMYLNFRDYYNNLGGPNLMSGINNTSGFTDQQIEFILKMNVVKYKGYMDSDLCGITAHENIQHLMPASTDHGAQVDHSSARAGSGCNAYSNARVISARLNKALNNKQTNAEVQQALQKLASV